jgi:hypothetical protein
MPRKNLSALRHQPRRSASTSSLGHSNKVVPKLLPDEFILGWLRRFAIANCRNDTWQFIREIRKEEKATEDSSAIYLTSSLVSDHTAIPNAELLRLHTLTPWFQFCGTVESQGHPEEYKANRRAIQINSHRSALCPNCIDEDRAFWGWNYWRIFHQIPGVTRCLKHQMDLHFSPSLCFTTHAPSSARSFSKPGADSSDFGKKYSELAVSMWEEAGPGSQVELIARLSFLLEERSGKTELQHAREFLAAEANLKIPDSWIHHAFFGKAGKKKMIKSLCCQYPTRLSPIQLAVALNLLFDDADEALMFWRGHQVLAQSTVVQKSAGILQT